MKTALLKIATVLMLIAGNKTFAADHANTAKYTEMTWIQNFYKIEARGNVHLHLLSGKKNKVEMKGSYYDHNALAQVENGVLRLTCYSAERLDVWVTMNDLSALDAYDNVLVNSEGVFSSLDLDIKLFNNAKADLNLDCCHTSVKLNDKSMADISGSALEGELAYNYASTLNSKNFIANQMSVERTPPARQMMAAYAVNDKSEDMLDSSMNIIKPLISSNTSLITKSRLN